MNRVFAGAKSALLGQPYRRLVVLFAVVLSTSFVATCSAQVTHLKVVERSHSLHQHFYCTPSYSVSDCTWQLALLRQVLGQYDTEDLGEWHWVLIARTEWKPLLAELGCLKSLTPSITSFVDRQTLLDEGLFSPDTDRARELLYEFHVPLRRLLNFAVTHEIAHAACREVSEAPVERAAERLRRGLALGCSPSTQSAARAGR